ncbi:hypothetical protein [Psychrobacter proteolyticus]|uniref:hypothetical protein n=1 Tax=Psychrobacter proteolyticus TaxID=147825 RepID=UPI0013B3EC5F|nr:hypothetical protein [Psychrobacter proteolyticus]
MTFIFGSLGALLEGSLVAGLLMLVGGILLLPPIKRLILDKKPNLSRGKITVVGSILIFISMFFFTSNDAEKPDSSVESKPIKETVEKEEIVELAATPIENKIIEEETKIDKPVKVLQTTPPEQSMAEKRKDVDPVKAREVLDKVDQEVKAAKGFNLEDITEVAKKSRRMKALLEDESAPFGDENEKIGRLCDSTRRQAFTYWLQVISEKRKKEPQLTKDMLQYYQESKKPCLDALKEFENSL